MLGTLLFLVWGMMWAIYFMLDGFDLGIGTLLPFLSKKSGQKKVLLNTMGPFWDGNEVWLISAGAFTFGAFPITYSKMFSELYTPLMLLLFCLIIRGVSIEFRGKFASEKWMKLFEGTLSVSSFLAALLLGVAFANIFRGLQLDGNSAYAGTLSLFNSYGLLGGVLFVMMFLVHGLLWIAIKTAGELHDKAIRLAKKLWFVLAAVAVAFLLYSWFDTNLYVNYLKHPVLFIIPVLAVVGLLGMFVYMGKREWFAWLFSSMFIVGAAVFGVVGLYPMLLPFRYATPLPGGDIHDPVITRTIENSASTPMTLKIMLLVAVIIVPMVIIYQVWAYRVFSHKVHEEDLTPTNSY